MTEAKFEGRALPPGWRAVAPPGAGVDVLDGSLRLVTPAGAQWEPVSETTQRLMGPYVSTPLAGGDLDLAVHLAEEVSNHPGGGLDLVVAGSGAEVVRCTLRARAVASDADLEAEPDVYVRDHTGGWRPTVAALGMDGGHGAWLRLRRTGTTWTFLQSPSGLPNEWAAVASFDSPLVPQSFALHASAMASEGEVGREQRIRAVVDLAARASEDATTPPPPVRRRTRHVLDLAGDTLPDWLRAEQAHGGTVTVHDDRVRMGTDMSVVGSRAWLVAAASPTDDFGALVCYRNVHGSRRGYLVLGIRLDSTELEAPGLTVPVDQYGVGLGYMLEVNGGSLIRRFLRRNPARSAGWRFEEPYTFLRVHRNAVDPSNAWIWMRLEAIGGWIRGRQWPAGTREPKTWHFAGEDAMRQGRGAALTLSHNDDNLEAFEAVVDVAAFSIYEVRRQHRTARSG